MTKLRPLVSCIKTSKPGAVKAPTPAKVAEQLAAAEIAFQKNPKDPETRANVEALRRTAAQLAQKTVFSTGEFGDKRLAGLEEGQNILRQTAARTAAKDAVKALLGNREYMNAKPEVQAQMRAAAVATEYAGYGLKPPEATAPAAPKAVAAPAAKAVPASQIPAGTTFGKAVPGKGTEVLKDGKVIGYAN